MTKKEMPNELKILADERDKRLAADPAPQSDGRSSKSAEMLLIIENSIKEYYWTSENVGYIKINLGGHDEIIRIGDEKFRFLLAYMFRQANGITNRKILTK